MSAQFQLIEKIRTRYTGDNLGMTDLQLESVASLQENLHRALEHLSEGLYSKDNHFVMELIQNADDNDYLDGIIPELNFFVDNSKIHIINNEKGFFEENVKSICSVGESTKKNRKVEGYIGEKGIGFKSVFIISDEPHIFSNGYQFKFRQKNSNEKLGFIVPYWVDEKFDFIEESKTNIILPIRTTMRNEVNKFNDFDHSLLLFMKKLKKIEINNISKKISVERKDRGNNIELHINGKNEIWKLVKQQIEIPKTLVEDKREKINSTEIVLAFPLDEVLNAQTDNKYNIFAFLPVRNYGFRFIIQADFLLTSNREDLYKDREWNKNIRDNISKAFFSAIESFKIDENLKYSYYSYLPEENEISDNFFEIVAEGIYDVVKNNNSIFTEANNWKLPKDTVFVDELFKDVISNKDLISFFNKEYISNKIIAKKSILKRLGVSDLSKENLFEFLKNNSWIQGREISWFNKLYELLDNLDVKREDFETLKSLEIFRTIKGRTLSLTENKLFFPLEGVTNALYDFFNDINFINPSTLKFQNEGLYNRCISLFTQLGVKNTTPAEIIENHILPTYIDGSFRNKSKIIQINYVKYIKDNFKTYYDTYGSGGLERLRKYLSFYCINEDGYEELKFVKECHISEIYGNTNKLEYLLKGNKEVFYVSPVYLSENEKNDDKSLLLWEEFLAKLNVHNGFIIISETTNGNYLNLKEFSDKKYNFKSFQDLEKVCVVSNLLCEEIEYALNNFNGSKYDEKIVTSELILSVLYKNWEVSADNNEKYVKTFKMNNYNFWDYLMYSRKFNDKVLFYFQGNFRGTKSELLDSSFKFLVAQTSLILATDGKFYKPAEIFINKPEIYAILGDSIPYVKDKSFSEKFYEGIGVNTSANVNSVLNYLEKLSNLKNGDIQTLTSIYRFIENSFRGNEDTIKSSFLNKDLIFIPDSRRKYYSTNDVIWEECFSIFGENKGYLESSYPTLKTFFVEKLGVSLRPEPEDYVRVLKELQQKQKLSLEDVEIVSKIYKGLNYFFNPEFYTFNRESQWYLELLNKNLFLTYENKFEYGSNLIAVDTSIYDDLLSDCCNLNLLNIPDNFTPKIEYFLNNLKIKKLSNTVVISLARVENKILNENLSNYIKGINLLIARYIFKKDNFIYESLKNQGRFNVLQNITCYDATILDVNYSIVYYNFKKSKVAFYDKEKNTLYFNVNEGASDKYIWSEIVKFFDNFSGLFEFLCTIAKEENLEEYLSIAGIDTLPLDELSYFNRTCDKVMDSKIDSEEMVEKTIKENSVVNLIDSEIVVSNSSFGLTSFVSLIAPESSKIRIEKYREPLENKSAETNNNSDLAIKKYDTPYAETFYQGKEKWMSKKDRIDIGIWGEKYAMTFIRTKALEKYKNTEFFEMTNGFFLKSNGKECFKAIWLNAREEQYQNHDIEIIVDGIVNFIEVKSTIANEKTFFNLSYNEWQLMKLKSENYWIYRVYNVGTLESKLEVLRNPYKLFIEGKISANPIKIWI